MTATVDDRPPTGPTAEHLAAGPDPLAPPLPPAPRPGFGRGRRWWPWPVVAAAVALAVTGGGYGLAASVGGPDRPAALGPGDVTVEIDVQHSLFADQPLRVVAGTRVRFVIVNGDPIAHEFIVGGPAVHARHQAGTEASHPSIPGEVSVPPNGTAVTTYRFTEPSPVEYACHLPGHYAYGMHGTVDVVPAD
jgi:uncharacterized cupredoxin-like copper-binding protein